MLTITVPSIEQYDETKNEFISSKEVELVLEHSLVSLSKWESKWCKPFLSKEEKSTEETLDYIACMTITKHVDPNVYRNLTAGVISEVNDYIGKPMTATTVSHMPGRTNREIVTAELIYYWMIALNIPFECQKWHLNRLLTLINVCNIKNGPHKKMGRREILQRNADLNAARRKSLGSKG